MLTSDPGHPFPKGRAPWGLFHRDLAGPTIMRQEELDALVLAIPERGRFLELGTWTGSTAAYCADRRPGVQFVSVDLFDFHPQTLALWQANQRPNMRLFVGFSADFLALCRAACFDVALADCSHDRAGVLDECTGAAALLGAGCPLLVHDYGEPDWPGVAAGVDEFCRRSGWQIAELIHTLAILRERAPADPSRNPSARAERRGVSEALEAVTLAQSAIF